MTKVKTTRDEIWTNGTKERERPKRIWPYWEVELPNEKGLKMNGAMTLPLQRRCLNRKCHLPRHFRCRSPTTTTMMMRWRMIVFDCLASPLPPPLPPPLVSWLPPCMVDVVVVAAVFLSGGRHRQTSNSHFFHSLYGFSFSFSVSVSLSFCGERLGEYICFCRCLSMSKSFPLFF